MPTFLATNFAHLLDSITSGESAFLAHGFSLTQGTRSYVAYRFILRLVRRGAGPKDLQSAQSLPRTHEKISGLLFQVIRKIPEELRRGLTRLFEPTLRSLRAQVKDVAAKQLFYSFTAYSLPKSRPSFGPDEDRFDHQSEGRWQVASGNNVVRGASGERRAGRVDL